LRWVIYLAVFATHGAELFITPPEKYPYLFPLCYAMIGYGVFSYVFLISNLVMVRELLMQDKK
jgi:hypothetical protein